MVTHVSILHNHNLKAPTYRLLYLHHLGNAKSDLCGTMTHFHIKLLLFAIGRLDPNVARCSLVIEFEY